jgi:hypothetical protein
VAGLLLLTPLPAPAVLQARLLLLLLLPPPPPPGVTDD